MSATVILITLEVLAFLATAGLAILWVSNPDGNYEPWIVISGVVGIGVELYRRFRTTMPTSVIEEIRAANGVRALRPLEDDKNLEELPNGVFGFTVPWALPKNSLALEGSKRGTSVVEIHKSNSGELFVIGFVSQEMQVQLEDPSRTTPINVHVFFSPYAEFIHPVAIPYNRIIHCKHRSIKRFELCDMRIK